MAIRAPPLNKKGIATELSLKEVAELVLVVIMVVLVWLMMSQVFGLFGGTDIEEESTINNFGRLVSSIQYLLDDGASFTQHTIPFYIPEDYFIIGFDRDWTRNNGNPHFQYVFTGGPILKPTLCGDLACLCLYKEEVEQDSQQEKDKNVMVCKTFDGPIRFIAEYHEQISDWGLSPHPPKFCGTKMTSPFQDDNELGNKTIDEADYGRFIIYGREYFSLQTGFLSKNRFPFPCGKWEARTLHLEKMDVRILDIEGKGDILIYAEIKDDDTLLRENAINALDEEYGMVVIKGKISIQGIPRITCSEKGSEFGRICQANPGLRNQLVKLSTEVMAKDKKDYTATITQAFRTWSVQNDFWQCWLDENDKNLDPRDCNAACNPGPNDGQIRCPHMTGGAIDIVFFDKEGKKITPAEAERLMCGYDFVKYAGQGETWHFEYGTRQWDLAMGRKSNNQPYCTYG